ncbi:MAG: group II intron reverse transcriptase domain-containing protein, partial [Gilliamella sp.]|nr:group II intron reverse transcriptase domain-containing protein [Gilliamella sp.]
MNCLKKYIKCDKFLITVKKLLTAGYMEEDKVIKSNIGTPQGSVVSPILANIVLNEFDDLVENTIFKDYVKGERRKTNPEYNKLLSKRYSRKTGVLKTKAALDALHEMRKLPRHLVNDPYYRRSMYIRYADDFVYLFEGPRSEVLEIKQKLTKGLMEVCGLELNEKKTI